MEIVSQEQGVDVAREVLKSGLMDSAKSDLEGHDDRLGYGILNAFGWERSVAESLT